MQLARIFGIRIGVSASWFVFLFLLIYWLSHEYFPEVMNGSQTTVYLIAVAGALGYFASLILHELGHALIARRQGIPIVGIDLWFLGGLSQMRREPASAREIANFDRPRSSAMACNVTRMRCPRRWAFICMTLRFGIVLKEGRLT